MRNKRTVIVLLVSLLPCLAFAESKPPELSSFIQTTHPTGRASLHKFLLHVYDAEFWSDSGDWQKTPYSLSITYDMGFTADDLADRTTEEMHRISPLSNDALKAYNTKLRSIYPNIATGDRITAVQKNHEVTAFYYNGKFAGEIRDAAFGPAFFAIWLSPKSSEPEMQKKLLPNTQNRRDDD